MKKILREILVFIIIMVIFFGYQKKNAILKYFYKDDYREYVEEYSEKYNVDKNLIFAIIKAESNFDENAVSNAGAKGLMQIMDSTSKDIAEKIAVTINSDEDILNPKINIELGTKYISMLLEKYQNINLALAGYNAGSGNVDKWIEEGTLNKDGTNIENIPFLETNNYVRKILRDYEIYQKIYK